MISICGARVSSVGNQEINTMAADSYDLLQSMLKSFGFPIISRRTENLPLLAKLEKMD